MERTIADVLASWKERGVEWELRHFSNYSCGGMKDCDLIANKSTKELDRDLIDIAFASDRGIGNTRPLGYDETTLVYHDNDSGHAVIMGIGSVKALIEAGLEFKGSKILGDEVYASPVAQAVRGR